MKPVIMMGFGESSHRLVRVGQLSDEAPVVLLLAVDETSCVISGQTHGFDDGLFSRAVCSRGY